MLPAAAFFITGLFPAMQFHTLSVSCAVLAAAIVFSVLFRKIFPAILVSAGLLLGHFYTAGIPAQPVLRDKGFADAVFIITGFPALTEDGRYEVKSGDVTILSEEAYPLYRTQTVRALGPVTSFITNGRKTYRIFAKEIHAVDPGFRPFGAVSLVRKWVNDKIRLENVGDVRALLQTMILGNTHFLSFSVKQSFRMTGITHLLAISGLNVAVIGIGVFFLLKKLLGEKPALAVSCAVVVLYVVTAGFGASVLRAGIMFILYQTMKWSGKEPDILDVTAASLFPVLFFDPGMLFDMGFWLSYGALAGIILTSDGLRILLKPAGKTISEVLGTTLAANFTTLPMLVLFFSGFSLVSPLANLFILPVFNIITYLLFALFLLLLTGAGFLFPTAEIPLKILWNFSVRAADLFSMIPGAFVSFGPLSAGVFTGIYVLAVLVFAFLPGWTFHGRMKKLTQIRASAAGNNKV